MKKINENPQSAESKRLICEALTRLMSKQKLESISITGLCEEAGVSRQTFYRYYEDKKDVIEGYLYELSANYQNSNKPSATDMEGNIRSFYEKFPYPRQYLKLLYENNLLELAQSCFANSAKELFARQYFMPLLNSKKYDDFHIAFIASTVTCVLRVWIEGGFKETCEELANISIAFFRGTAK